MQSPACTGPGTAHSADFPLYPNKTNMTWNHRNHLPTLKIMILYTYVFFAVMLILPGLHTDTYSAHTCKAPSVHLICWPSWPSPKIDQNRKIVLWPWIPWTKNKEVRQQKRTNQKAQRVFDAVLSLHLHGKWMQVHWRWYSVTVSEKTKIRSNRAYSNIDMHIVC